MPIKTNWYIIQFRFLIFSLFLYSLYYFYAESPYLLEIYWLGGKENTPNNITQDIFGFFNFIAHSKTSIILLFALKLGAIFGLLYHRTLKLSLLVILLVQVISMNISSVTSPEMKYINFLLLCMLLIDYKKFSLWGRTDNSYWSYPYRIHFMFSFISLLAYTVSGYFKFLTPKWRSGEYLNYLMQEHFLPRSFIDVLPLQSLSYFLIAVCYFVLFVELFAVAFAFNQKMRLIIFLLLSFMQLGIFLSLDLAQISLGMLIGHIFMFDPKWLRYLNAHHRH